MRLRNNYKNPARLEIRCRDSAGSGHEDNELLQYSTSRSRILVSIDMDFSNVLHYTPSSHSGIIILKIRPATIEAVHQVLRQLLENLKEEEIHRSLVIVDRTKYRVRR